MTVGPIGQMSYNSDNQATSVPDGNFFGAFDGAGNPSDYVGLAASFDAENRLTEIAQGPGNTGPYIQATNDADGHVASQNVLGVGNNYFIYDGDHIVEVLNSDGTTNEIFGYGADGMRQSYQPNLTIF